MFCPGFLQVIDHHICEEDRSRSIPIFSCPVLRVAYPASMAQLRLHKYLDMQALGTIKMRLLKLSPIGRRRGNTQGSITSVEKGRWGSIVHGSWKVVCVHASSLTNVLDPWIQAQSTCAPRIIGYLICDGTSATRQARHVNMVNPGKGGRRKQAMFATDFPFVDRMASFVCTSVPMK